MLIKKVRPNPLPLIAPEHEDFIKTGKQALSMLDYILSEQHRKMAQCALLNIRKFVFDNRSCGCTAIDASYQNITMFRKRRQAR